MIHEAKIALLFLASFVPGRVGSEATTRLLRRRHVAASARANMEFESELSRLGPGNLIIDFGANVGEVAEKMVATGATVHAFEPDPWSFAQLSARLAGCPNAVLHQAAVGRVDGVAIMRRAPDFDREPRSLSVQTSFAGIAEELETGSTFEVPCIGFRGFLSKLGQPVDLVKMDIEGAEVEILLDYIYGPDISLVVSMYVENHEVNLASLRPETERLRTAIRNVKSPKINLDWQ